MARSQIQSNCEVKNHADEYDFSNFTQITQLEHESLVSRDSFPALKIRNSASPKRLPGHGEKSILSLSPLRFAVGTSLRPTPSSQIISFI